MTALQLRPRFDPVFNWGHILIFIGAIAVGIGIYIAFVRTSDNHEFRIGALEAQLAEQVKQSGQISEKLDGIRDDLTVLKTVAGR